MVRISAYINGSYRFVGTFKTLADAADFTEQTLICLQFWFPGLVTEWWIEGVSC